MTKSPTILVDYATQNTTIPHEQSFKQWATQVLKNHSQNKIVSIRLVGLEESAALNEQYRQKTGATNILSFNFEVPPGVKTDVLGDIVLCPAIIEQESQSETAYPLEASWAHLVIHGCLHLLDYCHDDELSFLKMKQLEVQYLADFGYPNPYD